MAQKSLEMMLEYQLLVRLSKNLARLHIITQETRWRHQNSNIFQLYEGLIRHCDVSDVRYQMCYSGKNM